MAKPHKLTFAFTGDKNFDRYDIIANGSKIADLHVTGGQYLGCFVLSGKERKMLIPALSVEDAVLGVAKTAWTGHKFAAPVVVTGKTKAEVLARLEKNMVEAQVRLEKTDVSRVDRQAWKFATKYA